MSSENKKVVHRLRRRKQPVVKNTTEDMRKLEELGEAPQTRNTQFFTEDNWFDQDVEDQWGGAATLAQSCGKRWLVTAVLVVCVFFMVCLSWGVLMVQTGDKKANAEIAAERDQQSEYSKKAKQRRDVIRQYLAATSVEEMAKWVRDPERTRALMEEHYAGKEIEKQEMLDEITERSFMTHQGIMWLVKARKPAQGISTYLVVESSDDGSARVDWENDVVYQPSDWQLFITERKSTPHEFRVYIQDVKLRSFHGYEFADYRKYRCFKLSIRGVDEPLWGYTERDSELDQRLLSLVGSGKQANPSATRRAKAMLTLRFPENSQSDQCVYIHEMLRVGWIQ
jgi:hypothetical protein